MSMYNLWPRPSLFVVSFVTVAWVAVLCAVLSQVYFHVIRVSSQVTKFENSDVETLAFLLYVLFENHPPFEGNKNFVNSQVFRRVVKSGKCASQNFKRSRISRSLSKFSSVLSGSFLLSPKCK